MLQVEELLGSTNSAIVQSVRCKRILLARKTIRCNRQLTRAKAIDEVAHLSRLNHSHVVRVIGTYVVGQELSILMYPVAQYNLETFLYDMTQEEKFTSKWSGQLESLRRFIFCLSNALAYIHQNMMKHMDIKPKNILVRYTPNSTLFPDHQYKVYIADFGIARSYTTLEAIETEGPTMFTRRYAAPEVVDRERRGLAADIFSLGCVFAEIIATLAGEAGVYVASPLTEASRSIPRGDQVLEEIHEIFAANMNGDKSFQANIAAVHDLLDAFHSSTIHTRELRSFRDRIEVFVVCCVDVIKEMMNSDPSKRPSAKDLVDLWGTANCCLMGAEPLEAAVG